MAAPARMSSPPSAQGQVMKRQVDSRTRGGKGANAPVVAEAFSADAASAAASLPATAKLAPALASLAEKVTKQGKDGNLTVDGVNVTDYKVDVMVYLSDASEKTLEALKKLGFIKTGESKAIRLLVGTIDVRKLEDLAKLDVVMRVTPVAAS
jgi:uncharacterized protein YaaR (DUF327 family)